MQGQPSNTPLDPNTHLTAPFDNANEAKTEEVKFCAYPKLSLINKNQRVSKLPDGKKEES